MFGFGRKRSESRHYYGSDTYKYINKVLDGPGDVMIMSPYIDTYYARKVAAKARGRTFYVLSSSADKEAIKIFRGGHPFLVFVASVLISLAVLYVLLLIGFYGIYLLLALVPSIAGLYTYLRGKPDIRFKVPRRFVHSKTYLSDTMAVTGSANLTYAGTHMNIEQITIITDEKEIYELKREFRNVWEKL